MYRSLIVDMCIYYLEYCLLFRVIFIIINIIIVIIIIIIINIIRTICDYLYCFIELLSFSSYEDCIYDFV